MIDQARRLPPLNALRVFHVVVRHRSFRSAAEELTVSPQLRLTASPHSGQVSGNIDIPAGNIRYEIFEFR